ncbi:MAG: 1-(5-phosphoribosyl)-5-[(5-phosphoribosylamino)methylideneamino]imidazole-4-carboxamide isomerase [Flavobacteriaceae bacterium]|nr:1-(5-phosphoribosyl)-5-[(5-phosphoribosylamino)methylideneamino]imidazole-4-carboxamide isomerase [Bacteroidia bacterium]NNF75518.1 1-(5-phosphoribosyl)-5-[(5-phosphoribosylamino)methylideneamino]imidazole-4-carboxamide isomerase [Flavobacteriaceae bacterium]
MRIIPAIDLIDGKCVRLTKGDYSTKVIYGEDPLEIAKQFEGVGIKYLHVVDLDGAKAKHIVNYKVLERLASETDLNIDFGGGIKTDDDLKVAFDSGAKQITGGSIAVKDPRRFTEWIKIYGGERIILGADCKDERIAVSGWTETSDLKVLPFIAEYMSLGISYVICTDISKDGMLEGPSFELYRKIIEHSNKINLIASGGISKMEDIYQLEKLGCEGAIVGKAIYENRISLKDLETYNLNN